MEKRKPRIKPTGFYRKALPGRVGILQAIHIWRKVLRLDQYKFEEAKNLTEKKVSVHTWEDCTERTYDEDPGFYKRLNQMVLEKIWELSPNIKIQRIYDKTPEGNMETRICRSNKKHARKIMVHKTSVASGLIASAVKDNEQHKLNENVGRLVMKPTMERIKELAGMTEDKAKEIIQDMTLSHAVEAGKLLGAQQVAGNILQILDNNPEIKAIDEKYDDEYSRQAKERRKEGGRK